MKKKIYKFNKQYNEPVVKNKHNWYIFSVFIIFVG